MCAMTTYGSEDGTIFTERDAQAEIHHTAGLLLAGRATKDQVKRTTKAAQKHGLLPLWAKELKNVLDLLINET